MLANRSWAFLRVLTWLWPMGFPVLLSAQHPFPEQDCMHALPICQSFIVQDQAYFGAGLHPHEINPQTSCMYGGERHSVWYRLEVQSEGWLRFLLTARDSISDYDWALFDLTQKDCQAIYSDPQALVRCNYGRTIHGCIAQTGLMDSTSGICNQAFEDPIFVQKGEVYLLNVSNYAGTPSGFTLDFSGSTADVLTPLQDPHIRLESTCDGELKLSFGVDIQLDSLWNSGSWLEDARGNKLPFQWVLDSAYAEHWGKEASIQWEDTLSFQEVTFYLRSPLIDRCGHVWAEPEPLKQWLGSELNPTLTCAASTYTFSLLLPDSLTLIWNDRHIGSSFSVDRSHGQWVEVVVKDRDRCIAQQRWWISGQRDVYQEASKHIPAFFCANETWIVPQLKDMIEDSVEWIMGTQEVMQGQALSFGESDSVIEIMLIRHLKGGCQDPYTWTVPVYRVSPIEIHTQGQCVDAPIVISIVKPEGGLQFAFEVDGEKTSFSKSFEFVRTFSTEGTYPIQVRTIDSQGCQSAQDAEIQVFAQPELPIVEVEVGCQPQPGNVWAMGNDLSDHLQWKTLEGEIRRTPSPYVWERGDFYPMIVQAVSKQGCISQPYEISWFDWNQSMWKVKWEETVHASGQVVIDGEIEGPEASFAWSDGRGYQQWGRKVQMVLTDTGRYLPSVQITTAEGCNWTFEGEEVEVVLSPSSALILPDAFSPNGDGINDVFFLTLQKTEGVIFNVFNNWGLEVFRASSGTIRWDGRDMQGRPVRPGVYSYQLTFNDTQGQPVRRSGTLTILY